MYSAIVRVCTCTCDLFEIKYSVCQRKEISPAGEKFDVVATRSQSRKREREKKMGIVLNRMTPSESPDRQSMLFARNKTVFRPKIKTKKHVEHSAKYNKGKIPIADNES